MICNSTPLICLAKLNQIELLKKLFNKITIPEAVKEEVVIDGKPGFAVIKRAIQDNWIIVENPKDNPDLKIGKGENSAINLAREKKDKLIIDDCLGINVAKSFDINYLRTTTVILLAFKNKILNKKEAKELIHRLIEQGYYMSPKIFSELLRIIDDE